MRAEHAVNEAVNSALAFNPGLKRAEIGIAFDELRLDADIDYEGVPVQLAEHAPTVEDLGTDAGIAALSTFMIRQYAVRVRIKSKKGICRIEIHLDH